MGESARQGMPIMLKELVIIEVVRLRAYDGSYIIPHEDKKNVTLHKQQDASSSMVPVPKAAEWKVIWSSEVGPTCNFVSTYGQVLTVRNKFYTKPRLFVEPWPVLDGAGDWNLKVVKTSTDGNKTFWAELVSPRISKYRSLELGRNGLTLYGEDIFSFWVPSPGWIIEIVESSVVVKNRNGDYERNFTPSNMVVNLVNQGTCIWNPQFVGGDYCNSGHNKNYNGIQASGATVMNAKG